MATTRAPRNFTIMRTGRRGFEVSRAPSTALLSAYGRAATVSGASDSGPAPGDIFTGDYSTLLGNFNNFRAEEGESGRTHSLVVGGGPRGLNAFQIALVAGSGASEFHCGRDIILPDYADGEWRYFRWYDWHDPLNTYQAQDGEGRMIYKRFLAGQGGSARFILNFNGEHNLNPYFAASFDGGPFYNNETEYGRQSRGQWIAVQLGVRFGNSAQYILWIDNDEFNSPTHTSVPASRSNTGNGYNVLGFYSNDGLAAGSRFTMRDAAFRVATSFDSNWHGWLNG